MAGRTRRALLIIGVVFPDRVMGDVANMRTMIGVLRGCQWNRIQPVKSNGDSDQVPGYYGVHIARRDQGVSCWACDVAGALIDRLPGAACGRRRARGLIHRAFR